jgi:hypothetical protein
MSKLKRWWRKTKAWVGGFLYGMLLYDMERALRKQHAELENLFALILFGDMIGIPILPPYYSLRLLPYIIPSINLWKRRLLRERDITDLLADLDG